MWLLLGDDYKNTPRRGGTEASIRLKAQLEDHAEGAEADGARAVILGSSGPFTRRWTSTPVQGQGERERRRRRQKTAQQIDGEQSAIKREMREENRLVEMEKRAEKKMCGGERK